jgi:hypothetical protein
MAEAQGCPGAWSTNCRGLGPTEQDAVCEAAVVSTAGVPNGMQTPEMVQTRG